MPSASSVVDDIHADLFGRAGFDEFWGEIQADTQAEIREAHVRIVARALGEADPSRIPYDELAALSLGRGRDR